MEGRVSSCCGSKSTAFAVLRVDFPVLRSISRMLALRARSEASCSASICCNRRKAVARS